MLQVNKLTLKTILNPAILLIISALFLSTLADQFLQKQVEDIISSKDGLTNMIWLWGFLSIISAIFFPLVVSILSCYVLVFSNENDTTIKSFFSENIELSLIETLRAWGKTFLWSLLFIIPGFIKYINYILTPYVVMFSKKYKNGEVDALQYSTLISKKFWWSIKMWLSVYFLIIPALMYFLFDEHRVFSTHPVTATALVILESFIELSFHYFILKLFIKYLNESEPHHGTYV